MGISRASRAKFYDDGGPDPFNFNGNLDVSSQGNTSPLQMDPL